MFKMHSLHNLNAIFSVVLHGFHKQDIIVVYTKLKHQTIKQYMQRYLHFRSQKLAAPSVFWAVWVLPTTRSRQGAFSNHTGELFIYF